MGTHSCSAAALTSAVRSSAPSVVKLVNVLRMSKPGMSFSVAQSTMPSMPVEDAAMYANSW